MMAFTTQSRVVAVCAVFALSLIGVSHAEEPDAANNPMFLTDGAMTVADTPQGRLVADPPRAAGGVTYVFRQPAKPDEGSEARDPMLLSDGATARRARFNDPTDIPWGIVRAPEVESADARWTEQVQPDDPAAAWFEGVGAYSESCGPTHDESICGDDPPVKPRCVKANLSKPFTYHPGCPPKCPPPTVT